MGKPKVSSRKKSSSRQKVYKMKGCSKKTRKNYLGGSGDVNLAYTGTDVPSVPNPYLAYTGKGGSSCSGNLTPNLNIPVNTNAMDKTVPNTGPISNGFNFLNPQGSQRGGCGTCNMTGGCGTCNMKGGSCMSCNKPLMMGGRSKKRGGGTSHRLACKCSTCKTKYMQGGNPGVPYADGIVGSPWTPTISGWPGVSGIQGNNNYLAPNDYKTDISRQMISTGANPPYSIGGRKTKKQRGGTDAFFIGSDLINLGRQFQFGVGSAYNALAGYSSPVNPMPWKDQLPNTPNLASIRAASY